MSYCVGCGSWAPGELCDACSFHTGRVWDAVESSYLQNHKNDSGANQDGLSSTGGGDE